MKRAALTTTTTTTATATTTTTTTIPISKALARRCEPERWQLAKRKQRRLNNEDKTNQINLPLNVQALRMHI